VAFLFLAAWETRNYIPWAEEICIGGMTGRGAFCWALRGDLRRWICVVMRYPPKAMLAGMYGGFDALCGLWTNGDVKDVYVLMLTSSVLEDVGYGLYYDEQLITPG